MIHAKADLFEMTPADHERMRTIARRQVRARIEHIATPIAPQQSIAAIEDAMIEGMEGNAKRTGYADQTLHWNQIKQHDAQLVILDALDTPKTASEIARQIGKSGHNVTNLLKRMLAQGRVSRTEHRTAAGAKWSRTETAYNPPSEVDMPSATKGEKTRAKVLEIMSKPMTAAEIAQAIGRHHTQTLEVMRKLIKSGHVTRYKVKGQHGYVFERVVPE